MNSTKCPRCGEEYTGYPALSRRINVKICPACGTDEAVRDFRGVSPLPFEAWAEDPRGE